MEENKYRYNDISERLRRMNRIYMGATIFMAALILLYLWMKQMNHNIKTVTVYGNTVVLLAFTVVNAVIYCRNKATSKLKVAVTMEMGIEYLLIGMQTDAHFITYILIASLALQIPYYDKKGLRRTSIGLGILYILVTVVQSVKGINVIDVDTICGIWGVLGILFIIAKIGDITIMFNDDALGSIAEEHEKEKRVLEEKSRLEALGREMAEKRREAAAAYESRKPELEDQIRRMQDALPLYAEQEKKRQAYETLEHQRTALTQNLKKMQNQLETCRTQEEILRNQEREAVEARAALAECRGRREQMERRQAVLQELGKCCEAERTWRKSLEKRQEKFQAAARAYQQSDQLYQDASCRFLAMQAGLLAAELQEGKPCPVCGSLEHPTPCRLETEPIREEQVEALRAGRDDADQKQRTAAEACQEAQISLEHESRRRIEIQGKLYGQNQDSPAAQPDADALEKELRQMAQEIRRCRQAEITYTDRIAMEETIRQKREANGAGQKKLEAALELKRSEVQQAAIESQTRRNELEELSKRLEWKDSRTLRVELEKRSRELETLAEAVTAADKKAQECREKCRELEGSLSSLREHMEADSETDPEEKIQQAIRHWEEEKTRWSRLHREHMSVRTRNEDAYAALRVYLQERDQLDREKQQISELYQTADGKLSGAARIDFQTYVQRQYFRQMIQAANRRLRRMTKGTFELQCRGLADLGKQGEVGLDLDVYSFVTDRVRDVKTLSGGESFLAALAMALGMADVIQNAAGSVKVDAMFIDEGFGSLDEESRTRAVQVLQELSGGRRLIGIISHVTELKEEMGHKLVVKKGNGGSQVHWEIED